MKITRAEVERVAPLARLSLHEEELDQYTEHFNSFLAYAEIFREIEKKGLTPHIYI